MVIARAWCRVDFGGGTLDIWPLGLLHPGARTVNVAVDLAVTVELRPAVDGKYLVRQGENRIEAASAAELAQRSETDLIGVIASALELPPFEVSLASESPRGGGLGASSAMTVAFLAAAEEAFGRPRSRPERIAALARDLEARLMGLPTGLQDHYPALLGGALEIRAEPGGERVRSLDVDLERLGASLLVVYSGQSHFSAGNNWQVVRRRLDGEAEVSGLFAGIAETAAELAPALEASDFRRVGELMSREWSYRRQLAAGISTPVLENLLAVASAHGAWGGKACGAGGGGCLAMLCPPELRNGIAVALRGAGGEILAARPVATPLSISSEV
ncbi:MAG: D-glycero-alpha-D-manno-heptose-7-phosphate kinase [Acidobacteriota bacterium]|jgi:D-glycero-alpha-D-manno-heptose-7-phosphate kinase|nr:D-glycero-alpha-D-manno-heptose-7-phosphate kinase [Acidobacteriota bacterium]